MNKKLLAVFSGTALLMASQVQGAANVEITWENPKEYADVKPSNESRKHFRERVFRKLDEHFVELAEKLPDGQTLMVTVTDLDLAGQVWPASFVGFGNSGSDVRLIKAYRYSSYDASVINCSMPIKLWFRSRLR